jgi:hypothetical protein
MASIFDKSQENLNKSQEDIARERSKVRPVPVTRQALYGDLIEEEQRLKTETADPFGFIEEELGRRKPVAPRREELEAEKQRRYEEATGTAEQRKRLAEVEDTLEAFGQTQEGRDQPASAILNDLDALKSERDALRSEISEKQVTTTSEGTRVLIPTPETADNPLMVMGARAVSEAGRGIASLFGEENAIPQIRDESDVVNVGSEVLQLASGGAGGAIIASKILGKALKFTPKARNWYGTLLGAPAGEAVVATAETGSLQGEEGDTTFDRKLDVLLEGIGFGTILTAGGRAIGTVIELSPIARVLRSLPVALMGTREGAEQLAGDTLAELIARAENATTPEAKEAALKRIQENIATNFEAQTGVNFIDYVEGRAELPEGVTFRPTLGGVAGGEDSLAGPVISRVERGVAQKEGMPEFAGRMEEQRQAIQAGTERAVEETVPAGQRIEGETARQAAERLGAGAREDIGGVVEGRIEESRQQLVEPFEATLQQATRELEESMGEAGELTFAGLDRIRKNRQGANNAAEEAVEVVQEVYTAQRTQKADLYDEYATAIEDVEIPAAQFERELIDMVDERSIADVANILANMDPKYRAIVNQLAEQRRRLQSAISEQQSEIFGKLQNDLLEAKRAEGVESPKLTSQERRELADQAQSQIDMSRAIEEADFRDVKLSNVEGLLQAINSVKNAPNVRPEVQGAMNILSSGLEGVVIRTIGEGSDLMKTRQNAIQYFQNFNDLYRTSTGSMIVPNFRFGDKITNQQLAQAQDGLTSVLRQAKSNGAPLKFIQDMRASMDDETRAMFDLSLGKFYRQDIFSRVRFDPSTVAARENPQRAAQTMASQLSRVLADYPNLEKIVPRISDDLDALAKQLKEAGDNRERSEAALSVMQKRFDDLKEEVEATPEAKFATRPQETSSVKVVRQMLTDEDAQKTFERIWNTAGEAGQKGADGLTDAQRNLKVTFAQGSIDLLYPAGARGRESAELSFPQIERAIKENPIFDLVFPEGDPTRKTFNMLVEQARAVDRRQVRAVSGESATATITDVGQLVSELINYVQGPLSKEGRRSKMLSRVFFKLAGGPEQASSVLTEMMLDPRIANRLLQEAQDRARQTAEEVNSSLAKVAGAYILTRIGVNSMDQFNDEVESMVLETETEEAFN